MKNQSGFIIFKKKIYFIDVKVKSIVNRSVLKLNFAYHTETVAIAVNRSRAIG